MQKDDEDEEHAERSGKVHGDADQARKLQEYVEYVDIPGRCRETQVGADQPIKNIAICREAKKTQEYVEYAGIPGRCRETQVDADQPRKHRNMQRS